MKQRAHDPPLHAIHRVIEVNVVRQLRAMVGPGHGRHRRHPLWALGRRIPRGERALAVADQVDLVGPRFTANALDLHQQLLAAHFAGIQWCNLHRKHLRPACLQCRDDAVPIGEPCEAYEPEHAGDQHQRVTRGKGLRHEAGVQGDKVIGPS